MKYQCTFDDIVFDTWEETATCRENNHTVLKVFDDKEVNEFLRKQKEKENEFENILEKIELNPEEDVLNELLELYAKTIKDDKSLTSQILFNMLSAYTNNPNNLLISERSSEGKSYPAVEVAESFPKDHVIILGSATTQSFKYMKGIRVNSNNKSIEHELDFLDQQLAEEKDPKKLEEYKKKKRILLQNAKKLIDFRNKSIVFKEPPPFSLLEQLFSTLSHDQELNEFIQVNKGSRGENKGETIVFQGYPSMLICSARDDSTKERWGEAKSRFDIVSPNVSKKKYAEGMDLAFSRGLPKFLYEETVISDKDQERKKELVLKLIKLVKTSKGEIFNPFKDIISKIFPQEVGYRFRQGSRFSALLGLHCLCYSQQRPYVLIQNQKIPIVNFKDIEWANTISQDVDGLPPYKLSWLKETFLPAWKKKATPFKGDVSLQQTLAEPIFEGDLKAVIRANEIVDYVKEDQGGNTTTRQVRETYLKPLFEYGYIQKDQDPDNKKQDVYYPFKTEYIFSKTPINSYSPITPSGVKSCLEKYRIGRFDMMCNNRKYDMDSILPILFDGQNSYSPPEIESKPTIGV